MADPPLRRDFVDASTPPPNRISAVEYNLNAQRTDEAHDYAKEALDKKVAKGELAFNVTDYGAVGDGITDNGPAIVSCYQAIAAAGGGVMIFGASSGTYKVSSAVDISPTVSLTIDLNGQTLETVAPTLVQLSGVTAAGYVLAGPIAYGDTTITLTDAAGIEPGDIIAGFEASPWETTRNTNRFGSYYVVAKTGNTLTITPTSRMAFSIAASVTRHRPIGPVTVKNGTLFVSNVLNWADAGLILQGLMAPRAENVAVRTDSPGTARGNNINGFGIRARSCHHAVFRGTHAYDIAYGIQVGNSVATTVTDITAENCRHPVEVGSSSVGTYIKGVSSFNGYSAIDSHEAFETHYQDVYGINDSYFPKMDCIGGSIRNALIHTTADDSDTGPYYHRLSANDLTIYDNRNSRLVLDDYRIIAPNRTKATIGGLYGHLEYRNIVAQATSSPGVQPLSFTQPLSVVIDNCRNPDGTPWPRYASRTDASLPGTESLPAYQDGATPGLYHIDPYKTWVNSRDGILKCYGRILDKNAANPTNIALRVHTNAFPSRESGQDYSRWVFGTLRLRALARQSTTLGDVHAAEFHFMHRVMGISTVNMGATPARSDALSGTTDEGLTIAVSNISQAGATELGSVFPDSYVQFDVSIAATTYASPIFGLTYELELARQTD